MWNRAALAAVLALAGCRAHPAEPHFPAAQRDVAPIVGGTFSTEDARDRSGEAEEVMQLAGVKPGMSVADVGAGEGYYTVRLAKVVGPKGRVLAEDIVPDVRDALSDRVQRDRLDNVAVKLGTADDPMLPASSFDRVFLVHMYHEVASPYAFLWHMREGVRPTVSSSSSIPTGRSVSTECLRPSSNASSPRLACSRSSSAVVTRRRLFDGVQARRAPSCAGKDHTL